MLKSRKVAVTGGLACGKSSVCHFFKQNGAYVVSADEIVHQLLSHDQKLTKEVCDLLGEEVLKEGKLSRRAIAKQVFDQPQLLLQLERLIHPRVFKELERHQADSHTHPLFVAEIPLLFETGAENNYDTTIAVTSDHALERSGLSAEEFKKRSARQLSPEEKAERAHLVIQNNGSLEALRLATQKVYNQLTQ